MKPAALPRKHPSTSRAPEPGTLWEEKTTGALFEVTGHIVGRGGIVVIGIRPGTGKRGRVKLDGMLVRYWPVRNR